MKTYRADFIRNPGMISPATLFAQIKTVVEYAAIIPENGSWKITAITTNCEETLDDWIHRKLRKFLDRAAADQNADFREEEKSELQLGKEWGALSAKAAANPGAYIWPVRLSGIEIQSRRELLGLEAKELGELCNTNKVNVFQWEQGTRQAPYRIALILDQLEKQTDRIVESLKDHYDSNPYSTHHLTAYRTTEELKQAEPTLPTWATAKWWRQLIAQVKRRIRT